MKMIATLAAFAGAMLAAPPVAAQDEADAREGEGAEPVEVMVLGVFHFANRNLDVVNIAVDDVLRADRQAELDALSRALAAYAPDRIFVEVQSRSADLSLPAYMQYGPAMLASDPDETVQIGYRLAALLGHEAVYGFNEQPDADEPDYFPFEPLQAYADEHGMADRIAAIVAHVTQWAAEQEAAQAHASLPVMLLGHNDPARLRTMHDLSYNGLLTIGDEDAQPGAELLGMWYLRNAKMFAKLGLVAQPGERALVIVGSGHKFWLDQLADHTPAYESVSPVPYLEMAARMAAAQGTGRAAPQ